MLHKKDNSPVNTIDTVSNFENNSISSGNTGETSSSSLSFSVPYISDLKYFFYHNRPILKPLISGIYPEKSRKPKTILWFTDTINDLNGPSVTLKKLGWLSHERGMNLHLVSSLSEDEMCSELPPNLINLPFIYSFKLPYYDKYTLKVPAIKKSLEILKKYKPDEIYISTPGPLGFFALYAARVLKACAIGVYHTDFYLQSSAVVNNRIVPWIVEKALRWYYSRMDELQVPTKEYIDILEKRGYDHSKMTIFRRGIDSDFFSIEENGKTLIMNQFGIRDGITLLFTGRMSPDKNLDFLMDLYKKLITKRNNINLLMVGDGPYLQDLKSSMRDYPRVIFTGKLPQSMLPEIYSGSDIFLFPSIADTFGMSVLEAQSCGLPAVVSDEGGPKEIIQDGLTGFIARANDLKEWTSKLESLIDTIENRFEDYIDIKDRARSNIAENYTWEAVLSALAGTEQEAETQRSIA